MANVKQAIRFFCGCRSPQFLSFDSTISMSDVYDLARNIGHITEPEFNIRKCQILISACRFIASYFEHCLDTDIGTGVSIEPFVKELHRVLQQVKGLLAGYSDAESWSPLLLLKEENTEAFVHLIYDLRCAFVSVHDMRWPFPWVYDGSRTMERSLADSVFMECSREYLEHASRLDRCSILTNLSHTLQVEANQIESSGISPGNYFMQTRFRPYFKNFPYVKGFVLPLDPQDLRIQRKIAQTRYAQVYEGIWYKEIRVAIKTYMACCHDLCRQEASVHANLNHPNIVQFIGVAKDEDGNASSVVTELMSFTTLQDEMDNRREEGRPFTSLEAINIIIQIARGMSYLHSQGVVHRDVKPSNILICSCKNCKCVGNMGSLHVKIADFGDAKMASSELGTPNVGTHRWMAPEVQSFNRRDPSQKAYTYRADVYSFGILCYEIVTGKLPFAGVGTREYYQRIGAGERPELPAECAEGMARLIKSCWAGKARKRPDFGHICKVLHGLREVEMFGKTVNHPFYDRYYADGALEKFPKN